MGGDSTQSLCARRGNCDSNLRILLPTLGKAQFFLLQPSICPHSGEHLDPSHAVRSLPNDHFSAARPHSELGSFDVCRPACWPVLGPACIFLTLIASICNHHSRRDEAYRVLKEQAGGPRGFDFQCLLLASCRVMPMAPITLWGQQSLQGGEVPGMSCENASGKQLLGVIEMSCSLAELPQSHSEVSHSPHGRSVWLWGPQHTEPCQSQAALSQKERWGPRPALKMGIEMDFKGQAGRGGTIRTIRTKWPLCSLTYRQPGTASWASEGIG